MRNRITWKGFGKYLNKQKNNHKFYCGGDARCPIAGYVLSVFKGKAKQASVRGHNYISYKDKYGTYIKVTAPQIMSVFIERFDNADKNSALSAKKIYKEVSEELGVK